jgi:hypothetical protein
MTELLYLVSYEYTNLSDVGVIEKHTEVEPTGRWRLVKPEGSDEWRLDIEIWQERFVTVRKFFRKKVITERYPDFYPEYMLQLRSAREEQIFQCASRG